MWCDVMMSRANYSVVARCEVHGTAVKPGMKAGEKQYMSAFALNEWDSKLAGGVEWRQKIDTQVCIGRGVCVPNRGVVVAYDRRCRRF